MDPKNNPKIYILRKPHPFQLSLLQGTLVYIYELKSWQNKKFFKIEGASRQEYPSEGPGNASATFEFSPNFL